MMIELFFYCYIVFVLLLALKKYVPFLKGLFNGHSIGEWAMYSVPIGPRYYSAHIGNQKQGFEGFQPLRDITELSTKFLWHNFHGGQFVSIALPDFHEKSFREFSSFLAGQKEVREIASAVRQSNPSNSDNLMVELSFSHETGKKVFDCTSKSKINI